jgi:hypothetical protein
MLTGVINLRTLAGSRVRLNAALRRQRYLVARPGGVIASPYLYKEHGEGKKGEKILVPVHFSWRENSRD